MSQIPEILVGESDESYRERFLINPDMIKLYPDIAKRSAVCYSKIKDSKRNKKTFTKIPVFHPGN